MPIDIIILSSFESVKFSPALVFFVSALKCRHSVELPKLIARIGTYIALCVPAHTCQLNVCKHPQDHAVESGGKIRLAILL